MRVCVTKSIYSEGEDFDCADAVFDCIGDKGSERFGFNDLTTPGEFWLNPPLPVDEHGNWYRSGEQHEAHEEGGAAGAGAAVVDPALAPWVGAAAGERRPPCRDVVGRVYFAVISQN